MNIKEALGQAAFEAYRDSRKGIAYDGTPIPKWDDSASGVREGWAIAAGRVYELITLEGKRIGDVYDIPPKLRKALAIQAPETSLMLLLAARSMILPGSALAHHWDLIISDVEMTAQYVKAHLAKSE